MKYNLFRSPFGSVVISADETGITGVHMENDRFFLEIPKDWVRDEKSLLLKKAEVQLLEYFQKKRNSFNLPLSQNGTIFQKRVWRVISEIPYGETISYKEIATKIGHPLAVRAVGSAVGKNPICIMVPCHRVLNTGGRIGGYVAGVGVKKSLLELEQE